MEFTLEFKEDGNFEMHYNGVICYKEYHPVLKKWTVIYPNNEINLLDNETN